MTAFRPVLMALALASMASTVVAQQVVPAQSQIVFTSHQMGVPVEGRFNRWSASLSFDPKKPEAGRVSFTIETASASFGVKETDAELPKPEWFSVAKFPSASFTSTSIKAKGAGRYEVAGRLTVKGRTHDVLVPIALTQAGTATTATGGFTLKRTDYRIGEGEWADTSTVADDVQVRFKLALIGMGPL